MRTSVEPDGDVPPVVEHSPEEREQSPRVIPTLPRKPGAKPVTSHAVQELLDVED
jgi:hypothetical protein